MAQAHDLSPTPKLTVAGGLLGFERPRRWAAVSDVGKLRGWPCEDWVINAAQQSAPSRQNAQQFLLNSTA